jgi:hypothetical protein
LSACSFYAVNRWLIEPICAWPFLHEYFNDLLLIPAALPLVLGLQRWIWLRNHDGPPTASEIFGHLMVWSLVSELAGPFIFPRAISDVLDVLAYSLGALVAGAWWNRRALASWMTDALEPSPTARFDHLARHYDWMELLLAGASWRGAAMRFGTRSLLFKTLCWQVKATGNFLRRCSNAIPLRG